MQRFPANTPNTLFLQIIFMTKKILTTFSVILLALVSMAQSTTPAIDKSPMDMCYYPADYPVLKIRDKATEPLTARVVYSRPKREGRTIFGSLVEYGKVWRLGANEATEIEFYKNVSIGGKKISKGRYTLYAIPYEASWTFIINKETDTWGSFKYSVSKDVVRVDVPVQKSSEMAESLGMSFQKNNGNIQLVVTWENVKAALPITIL
jgi:hypothetical protein